MSVEKGGLRDGDAWLWSTDPSVLAQRLDPHHARWGSEIELDVLGKLYGICIEVENQGALFKIGANYGEVIEISEDAQRELVARNIISNIDGHFIIQIEGRRELAERLGVIQDIDDVQKWLRDHGHYTKNQNLDAPQDSLDRRIRERLKERGVLGVKQIGVDPIYCFQLGECEGAPVDRDTIVTRISAVSDVLRDKVLSAYNPPMAKVRLIHYPGHWEFGAVIQPYPDSAPGAAPPPLASPVVPASPPPSAPLSPTEIRTLAEVNSRLDLYKNGLLKRTIDLECQKKAKKDRKKDISEETKEINLIDKKVGFIDRAQKALNGAGPISNRIEAFTQVAKEAIADNSMNTHRDKSFKWLFRKILWGITKVFCSKRVFGFFDKTQGVRELTEDKEILCKVRPSISMGG